MRGAPETDAGCLDQIQRRWLVGRLEHEPENLRELLEDVRLTLNRRRRQTRLEAKNT